MYMDGENEFCNADALTATAASETVIDMMVARRGRGGPLPIWANVQTALASAGGTATLNVDLQTDDNEDFDHATTLWSVDGIAEADLVAGYRFNLPDIPENTERYVRLYFVVGTEDFTSGNIDAGIVADKQSNDYDVMAGIIS